MLKVLVVHGRYVFGIYTMVPSLSRTQAKNLKRNATTAPVCRVKMTQVPVPPLKGPDRGLMVSSGRPCGEAFKNR